MVIVVVLCVIKYIVYMNVNIRIINDVNINRFEKWPVRVSPKAIIKKE